MQQFIRLQQKRGIAWPTAELLLISQVGFVQEKAAGLERRNQRREELALQIEEHQDKIVLLDAKVPHLIQICNFSADQKFLADWSKRSGSISLCQSNTHVRNIKHLCAPATLGQPDGVASRSACYIKRATGREAREKLIIGAYKKRIRLKRGVRLLAEFLVPY